MISTSFYKNKIITACIVVAVAMITALSCNKPFPNTLQGSNNPGAQNPAIVNKTLVIVVDGAVGEEVQAATPPVLNSLVDFSIYSWDGLSDFKNNTITNQYAWSTLLTGVNSAKHNVTGTDFSGNNFATYPTIFSRLKQVAPQLRTSAFCSSDEVATNLASDATVKNSYAGDDAATKEGVKAELNTNNPSFVLAQFHSVDAAGMAGAYSAGDPGYKNAILTVDGYIGEILTAMRNRSNFKNENWMVIITSNKGSNTAYNVPAALWSAFNDQRHNTFFFCYNPRFNSINPTKPGSIIPYLGTSPYYNGTQSQNKRAKVLSGGTTYDIGSSGSYTIQCKVKIPPGGYYYPAILSKRASFSGGVVGWVFFLEGNYWQVNFGQSGKGNRQIRGGVICDGQWHTLTVVIRQVDASTRNVYTYTDGVLYTSVSPSTRNINSYGNLNSPQPLTVGNLPPDNVTNLSNYLVTDIRMYNTDLSDNYVVNNYCQTDVASSDPYKSNLIGYWPCTSVNTDNTMSDLSVNNHSLVLDSYSPGSFNDMSTLVCPTITDGIYKTVPNAVDVVFQTYQWMGISVLSSWGLDGKTWVPTYSDLGG
ncbi:MAG: DUF4983 domain-containing protein [Bacteroidetes bacterium]|nr:DUF4983 domain-containing protein [Bacteroidota bacterium]MBS1756677.1 DUF4983 domain-containing protein [Bacteroidota bacterium]